MVYSGSPVLVGGGGNSSWSQFVTTTFTFNNVKSLHLTVIDHFDFSMS